MYIVYFWKQTKKRIQVNWQSWKHINVSFTHAPILDVVCTVCSILTENILLNEWMAEFISKQIDRFKFFFFKLQVWGNTKYLASPNEIIFKL